MKYLVFDTSSIITLAMNGLLETLRDLKISFQGDFVIPKGVENELVKVPMKSRKYKLEAMMILKLINDGELIIEYVENTSKVLEIANSIFTVKGRNLHIVDAGEIEALMLALNLKAEAFVVDERTMRLLIEAPYELRGIFEKKLHTQVHVNKNKLDEFSRMFKKIKVIRSSELILIAYEKGLLKYYLPEFKKKEIVDGLLWGLRLRGCAISSEEIFELERNY